MQNHTVTPDLGIIQILHEIFTVFPSTRTESLDDKKPLF